MNPIRNNKVKQTVLGKPKIKDDWGVREYHWRTIGGTVIIIERDGIASTVCWGAASRRQSVFLPNSDNQWLPSWVLPCLAAYGNISGQ